MVLSSDLWNTKSAKPTAIPNVQFQVANSSRSTTFKNANQVVERGKQQRRACQQRPPDEAQRDRGRRRVVDRHVGRDQIRILRGPPPPQNQRRLRGRANSGPPELSRPQGVDRADREDRRGNLQRPRPPTARQPMADRRRAVLGEQEDGERHHADRYRRGQRAQAKILAQRFVSGLDRQIDRRQKREQSEREEPDGERKGRQPRGDEGGDEIRILAPNPPRRNRADYHAQQNRRYQTGHRKDPPPSPLHVVRPPVVAAESEGRSAKDNADQHQRQRDVQRDRDRGESGRERGEEKDYDQDQPDVVRLPDRPYGFGYQFALRPLARA